MEESLQDIDLTQREIVDGVVLFKRKRSSLWQARLRRTTGKWLTISTKTTDFEKAKGVALTRQSAMLEAQRMGQVDVTRRFADVAKLTISHLQAEIDNGAAKSVNHDYIAAINRYLIPCLGKLQVHSIGRAELLRLDTFRREKLGRVASQSTINTHNAALNRVFKTAIDRSFMLQLQVPSVINNGRSVGIRPFFDADDYNKVARNLREFVKTGHKSTTQEIRELLRDYVLILGNTGMRPGRESLNLKWNQIKRIKVEREFHNDGKQVTALEFSVNGKTGHRTLVARDADENVTKPLRRLQQRFSELKNLKENELFKTDCYVFRLASGEVPHNERLIKTFKIFLSTYDLLKNREGRVRSLYSLRHTYATKAIVNGTSMETLAVQMGTSQAMLERHYNQMKPHMKAAELSGWMHKKQRAATSQVNQVEQLQAMVAALLAQNNELRGKLDHKTED